jgi:hypothetical protein
MSLYEIKNRFNKLILSVLGAEDIQHCIHHNKD